MSDLPTVHGPALFHACLKYQPSDFVVEELLDLPIDNDGEHWLLQIEKRRLNTEDVIRLLAEAFEATAVDIGYCGMKDRQAVTRQWFTVRSQLPLDAWHAAIERFNRQSADADADADADAQAPRLSLLQARRHGRKLRHGAHRGNHFSITLRDVIPTAAVSGSALRERVGERVEAIIGQGFPNYIGPQRFGRDGRNLQRARQWFRQPRRRTSRQQRSLWLSAARSELFNQVCAARVSAGCWHHLLDGEPAVLAGSRSFFATSGEDPNELEQRLRSFDIHASAPWWGRGRSPANGECATFETGVLEPLGDLQEGLERAGLSQERRALRAVAGSLMLHWQDEKTLNLSVDLAPGVFATILLQEFGYCSEPERDG